MDIIQSILFIAASLMTISLTHGQTSSSPSSTTTSATTTTTIKSTTSTVSSGQGSNSGSVNPDNTVSVYNPSEPASCNYDFTGPADDIFIIDRSESVNKDNFHISKVFIQNLIKSSFILRKDNNRIAIITYTEVATIKINFLHSEDVISECEMFLPGGLWDTVLYDGKMKHGANLQGAIDLAKDILVREPEERKSVKKRVWIMTDFENTNVNVSPKTNFPGVHFYGVGVGAYNTAEEDKNFYEVITEEPGCRYRKIKDWDKALGTFAAAKEKQGFSLGDKVTVSEQTLCANIKNCTSQCTCEEFDHHTTGLKCIDSDSEKVNLPNKAISEKTWTIIIAIFATVFGIIFIIVVVLSVWCCLKIRMKKQPKKFNTLPTLSRSEGTSTDTMSTNVTDASTYTNVSHLQPGQYPTLHSQSQVNSSPNPTNGHATQVANEDEDLYVNGDIADILKAHGIVQDGTNPRPNTAQNNKKARSEIKGKGKYKKNTPLHETVSSPGNIQPSRQISLISTATSNHSYIEPICDHPNDLNNPGKQQRHPYSYAYMDSTGNRRYQPTKDNDLKSPASSHSYEKFNFNPGEPQNNFDSELTSKLQRMRNRISGAFSKKSKKQTANNPETVAQNGHLRFPNAIPGTSLYQATHESQPMYIDPNANVNTLPPLVENNEPGNRSSTKLGTMKFKNILTKFSVPDQVVVGNQHQYEVGPNGPYSVVDVDNRNSSEMPKPFREIM